MSASSGSFQAEELRSPARLPGLVMAAPFVQETLYSVPQPGETTGLAVQKHTDYTFTLLCTSKINLIVKLNLINLIHAHSVYY